MTTARKNNATKAKPVEKKCDCIAYESADGEDFGACHCGHSPEEHDREGCHGEVRQP